MTPAQQAARIALNTIATQLTKHPFADVILYNGKYRRRSEARQLERELWPLAYPKEPV